MREQRTGIPLAEGLSCTLDFAHKLSLSYMVHHTFPSESHRQAVSARTVRRCFSSHTLPSVCAFATQEVYFIQDTFWVAHRPSG
jgi:hypothetical protein